MKNVSALMRQPSRKCTLVQDLSSWAISYGGLATLGDYIASSGISRETFFQYKDTRAPRVRIMITTIMLERNNCVMNREERERMGPRLCRKIAKSPAPPVMVHYERWHVVPQANYQTIQLAAGGPVTSFDISWLVSTAPGHIFQGNR